MRTRRRGPGPVCFMGRVRIGFAGAPGISAVPMSSSVAGSVRMHYAGTFYQEKLTMRTGHLDHLPALCVQPLSIDERLVLDQAWVFQTKLHVIRPLSTHHP